ncbi:MAG TPA: lipid-binding protein, partial [Pontibacter sp.]
MKLKYILLPVMFLSVGVLTSCDDDEDDEIEYTATYPLSGDWTVSYSIETAPGQFEPLVENGELLIYNTSENVATQIWVDDHENFWNFKVKANADISTRTFSAQNAVSVAMTEDEEGNPIPYDIEVNITDGKVFENAV